MPCNPHTYRLSLVGVNVVTVKVTAARFYLNNCAAGITLTVLDRSGANAGKLTERVWEKDLNESFEFLYLTEMKKALDSTTFSKNEPGESSN